MFSSRRDLTMLMSASDSQPQGAQPSQRSSSFGTQALVALVAAMEVVFQEEEEVSEEVHLDHPLLMVFKELLKRMKKSPIDFPHIGIAIADYNNLSSLFFRPPPHKGVYLTTTPSTTTTTFCSLKYGFILHANFHANKVKIKIQTLSLEKKNILYYYSSSFSSSSPPPTF
jgi:hypothetical protein